MVVMGGITVGTDREKMEVGFWGSNSRLVKFYALHNIFLLPNQIGEL